MKLPPKTKKEAVQRLIDGERFKDADGDLIWFDESRMRFIITVDVEGDQEIDGCWSHFKEWQPIPEWHEILIPENKRLCWVSDTAPTARLMAVWIEGKGGKGFYAHPEVSWKYATPVLPEHLDHG